MGIKDVTNRVLLLLPRRQGKSKDISREYNPFRLNHIMIYWCMLCLILLAVIIILCYGGHIVSEVQNSETVTAAMLVLAFLPVVVGGLSGFLTARLQYARIPSYVDVGRLTKRTMQWQGFLLGCILATVIVMGLNHLRKLSPHLNDLSLIILLSILGGAISSLLSFSGIVAVVRSWISHKIPEPLDNLIKASNFSVIQSFIDNGMFADANQQALDRYKTKGEVEAPRALGYRFLEFSRTHRMEGKRIFNETLQQNSADKEFFADKDLHCRYVCILYRMSEAYIDAALREFRKDIEPRIMATAYLMKASTYYLMGVREESEACADGCFKEKYELALEMLQEAMHVLPSMNIYILSFEGHGFKRLYGMKNFKEMFLMEKSVKLKLPKWNLGDDGAVNRRLLLEHALIDAGLRAYRLETVEQNDAQGDSRDIVETTARKNRGENGDGKGADSKERIEDVELYNDIIRRRVEHLNGIIDELARLDRKEREDE